LEDSVRSALRGEAAKRAPRRVVAYLAAAAALLLAAMLGVYLMSRPDRGDFAGSLADEYAAFRDGRLSLEPGGAAKLGAHFAEHGAPAAVYDLEAMGWRLEGGHVFHVRGVPASLSAYEGGPGRRLVCGMLPGGLADLPKDAERVIENGREFRVLRRGGITVVVWQEKTVLCALASDLPRDEILAVAVAKATRA
jgi:hypothetical protein